MHFCHEAAALTMRKRTEFVKRPGRKKHGRARRAIETCTPNARTGTPRNICNAAPRSIAPHGVMLRDAGGIAPRSIASNSDINAALRGVVFHGTVLRSITPLSITPSNADGITPRSTASIAPRGSSGIVFSGGMVFSGGIAFGGAKKRDDARWTNKRLVALDKRDRIAPVHGLHAQAHRVISARLVVQNHLRAQRLAQRSHVSMARDHHAPAEQTIGCSHNMADQRHVAKLSHEFIAPETRSHARCHNDASVLQCAVVGSVWHSGIRLCKFDGWTG